MAKREPLLLLLILLSHSRWGEAEPEDENGTLRAEEVPTAEAGPSEAPEVQREGTPEPTAVSPGIARGFLSVCPCDLHPGFCDLNCCCDTSCGPECNFGGPECPFSFCLPGSTRAASRVCLENSLIFQNNTPYHTEILPGLDGCALLFCVQLNDSKLNYWQQPQVVTETNFPALSAQYGGSSFIFPEQVQSSPSAFYRVGDPIQTYFSASSIMSVLKQPTNMGPSQLCIDENPAAFLESKHTSCIRILTDLISSCTTDPALDAVSYYHDFTVLKVPGNFTMFQSRQVNITPLSEPASPSLDGNTCYNVVSEVIYEIEFSGIHGIQNVSVQFRMVNISGNPGCTLEQHFSLHFGNRNPSFSKQRSGNPGYIKRAPLIALYNSTQQPITILQNQGDGHCSATERYMIGFGENVRTSCQFSMPFNLEEANCSHLQEILYQAFQWVHSPVSLAITGNANPAHPEEWNTVFYQKCSMQDEHCMLPISLEIQVMWAQVGLLSNPQAQVLGGRYYYLCKPLKSFIASMNMLPLTTTVAFTDVTKWPDPPRGQPKVSWKLPFDFFFPFKVALSRAMSSSVSRWRWQFRTHQRCPFVAIRGS
uniref:Tectonic-3 n=1 Tax=Pogona vitticeps TaxID=103695 RepID=A0A6J0UF00_9SAUR